MPITIHEAANGHLTISFNEMPDIYSAGIDLSNGSGVSLFKSGEGDCRPRRCNDWRSFACEEEFRASAAGFGISGGKLLQLTAINCFRPCSLNSTKPNEGVSLMARH